MWNRSELKNFGKAAFKNNYWYSVFAAFIAGIAAAGLTTYYSGNAGSNLQDITQDPAAGIAAMLIGIGSLLVVAINIFVLKPLEVGGNAFFLKNSDGPADLHVISDTFAESYMNKVITMFLRSLITTLWTLLFIIPGIIKSYAYRMVPYILAETPDIDALEALRLSEQMMKGHKWSAFVLDLSFIGWHLLTCLTCGIVGVFFTNPYVYATDAELYKAVKAEYLGKQPAQEDLQ